MVTIEIPDDREKFIRKHLELMDLLGSDYIKIMDLIEKRSIEDIEVLLNLVDSFKERGYFE